MKIESIEWLRQVMRGHNQFSCSCGKKFEDFDLWFNHMHISGHIILTDEEIDTIREYAQKLG